MSTGEHRTIMETLGAYALGQLSVAERARVRAHLDGCPTCRSELDNISPVASMLANVDATAFTVTPQPPADLEDEILAEVDRQRAQRPRGRPRWLTPVVAAAAAAVLAFPAGYLVAPSPPDMPLEEVDVAVRESDIEAEAEVIPHTWGMEITMTARGFDSGARYLVTVVSEDGARHDAGEFIGTGDDPMVCNLNSSVLREDAASFEVTHDEGTVVLTSSL